MKTLRLPAFVLGALALGSLFLTGCLNDSSSSRLPADEARLSLRMSVGNLDGSAKSGALHKGSVIKLKKLVVTLTSSFAGDSVIRDTVLADTGASFVSTSTNDQTFSKRYPIIPLRHWTVVVKTLDTRDSVIHRDSVVALNLLAGETRVMNLNLASRFVMYQVKFTVPDSLKSSKSQQAQKMIITRFVLKIDSAIAVDSTALAGFSSSAVHTIDFDYIRVNTTPDVTIEFYGHSEGTNDTLLFRAFLPDVNPEGPQPDVVAIYAGPGADGTGGAVGDMVIKIGKINTIVFTTNVDGTVAVKRPAH